MESWMYRRILLDYLFTVDVDFIATCPERARYHNMLVLELQKRKDSSTMSKRDDFKLAARSLAVLGHKEGLENPFFRSRKEKDKYRSMTSTIRAIMIGQQIDVVAGDFNGTAWRCSIRNNNSTIDEAFADSALPTPPGPTPLWGPGSIPNNWADVRGFLKPPDSDRYWKVRMHGDFSIPCTTLGLRPSDQSCHHEVWLHERTFCAVPLQQTKGSHRRGCKRPFSFFVMGRPFAASSI